MKCYRIDAPSHRKALLEKLGCDAGGVSIMARKMEVLLFRIRDLPCGAANILKQDALAVGADLAVPTGVVTCKKSHFDGILMGTPRQLGYLIKKEKAQPFGLKALAHELSQHLKEVRYTPKIMGVINANDDSFYPGSRYREKAALEAIETMIEEGAQIVDIGGVSSRPGSDAVDEEEEFARVAPIFRSLASSDLKKEAIFSIDSYRPKVVEAALKAGFGIVNDITGLADERIGRLAKAYGARLVIMHMQGTPKTMQRHPSYDDVMADVDDFFVRRLEKAWGLGLTKETVILDVGIGFGKTLVHNLTLIKNLAHFRHFGCELLIGASRKSMIDAVIPTPVQERLPGTLAIHLEALKRGATIVRCHDVAEHRQAMALSTAIEAADVWEEDA